MSWDRRTNISKRHLGNVPELNNSIPLMVERFNKGVKKVYEIHEDS